MSTNADNANNDDVKGARNIAMFGRIARRYDLANDVLSLGVHRQWRRVLLDRVDVKAGERALDCACGTGEVALALAAAGADVVGTDVCEPMLVQARKKGSVRFETADVQALPYDDATFDVVTIAWGIRNVSDPQLAIKEMARVLKPGGRLGVLEFGQPTGAFGAAYRFYGAQVLPRVGGLVAGDNDAYRWLNRSAAHFAAGDEFLEWMRPHFSTVSDQRLLFGLAHCYLGVR